jgi:radical SAM superfamily enzyme YgiQ (UPF0313 family)
VPPADLLVSGVHSIPEYPPIALGMCMTYAKQEFASEPRVQLSQHFIRTDQQLAELLENQHSSGPRRHVLLFSNYLWNTDANLHFSQLAKRLDPSCITIHGGPDTPAYTEAAKSFLIREPHVDFIVAGEGEETLKELLEALALGGGETADINGLRFLSNGTFVETAPRPRAPDVNKFPSPYLTGFFDSMDSNEVANWQSATIETYRGCPYACTFCDWGSIMGSKVKLFDLNRVIAEVEWAASRKIDAIWIADSNFGLLERDVEIARHICEVKKRTGFPRRMILTFAKNVKSHVVEMVRLMVDAGLLAQGIISLQTSDAATLRVIRRTNIKTTEYEKLRHEFAQSNLPLTVELMMALPGSTIAALKGDLSYHFDLPIEVFVHRTVMLPNSPMADHNYRREHRIEIDEQKRVIATATMGAADIETAEIICRVFQGVHRFGILRYILRWLQWERELNPLEVIHDLIGDGEAQAEHPLLGAFIRDASISTNGIDHLVNTVMSFREQLRIGASWGALSTQFISWASRRYNLGEHEAFDELGELQARLMPSEGRQFPEYVAMKHDAVQWYADWLSGSGAPLSSYGPDVLQLDDPQELSNRSYFESLRFVPSYSWELESPLARTRRAHAKHLS